MPECFVAKADELKDGDRRIVVSGATTPQDVADRLAGVSQDDRRGAEQRARLELLQEALANSGS